MPSNHFPTEGAVRVVLVPVLVQVSDPVQTSLLPTGPGQPLRHDHLQLQSCPSWASVMTQMRWLSLASGHAGDGEVGGCGEGSRGEQSTQSVPAKRNEIR